MTRARTEPFSPMKPPCRRPRSTWITIRSFWTRKRARSILRTPPLSLDVGAVAKGYAAQLTSDTLRENGWIRFAQCGRQRGLRGQAAGPDAISGWWA